MSTPFDDDKLHEECGVFGIFGHNDAAKMVALGLHALQHRGQEACGIVAYDGDHFYAHHAFGLVDDTFSKKDVIEALPGYIALGHNRYSTTGEPMFRNIQPMYADMAHGGFAVAHNGNLTNAHALRQDLVYRGSIFHSTSDTEVINHLVAVSREEAVQNKLIEALKHIIGAYSVLAVSAGMLMGVRDPYGIRPLVLGKVGDAHVLTSETCALDIIGAELVREIAPGELVIIDDSGVRSLFPFESKPHRFCIFEYVYFARPDSFVENRSVYEMRKQIGAELAKEAPCPQADIIVPVPDSGVPSAIGFAQQSRKPYEKGIIRNHYVGRTFIEPSDSIRHLGVKLKHNANKAYIEGKSVVLVDDSIVRGTTSRKIVEMVREAGAREVHVRISSPPTQFSCFYGIDTPSTTELLAHKMSVEEIRDFIRADSLAYVSIDGLYRAVGEQRRRNSGPQFCDACFTGDYPVELVDHNEKRTGNTVSGLRNLPHKAEG
ncbi:MAG: amidophosphoribosyltransferase [Alphaproteobacteria bacterium]|nr:amidophosphoribosyltransferase [Alphaproteobacteria bacterium]